MTTLRILGLTLIFCLFAPAAYAYIDPGTGSLIIQLIIGAIAAISIFFKTFWFRLKGLFGLSHNRPTSTDDITGPEDSAGIQSTSSSSSSEPTLPPENHRSS